MSTFSVSNAEQLNAAVAQATGGDVIELASGNYGDVDFNNIHFNDYVTITSADGNNGAVFNTIDIRGSSFIRIDGVHASNSGNGSAGSRVVQIIDDSHHIEFMNSEVNGKVDGDYTGFYGIYAHHTDNVTIANNDVHDVQNGITAFSANHFEVSENHVDYIGADAFKFAGINNFLIENNSSNGHMFPSPGAHLDFMQFQSDSSNGVIRGNVFLTNGVGWVQGIFLHDGNYTGITIEENVIYTGMANGIILSAGSGNTVINNTVLNSPGVVHNVTNISVISGTNVQNNISASYTGGSSGSNIKAQHDDPSDSFYYGDLFVNAHAGADITLADLAPVAGSIAETKGAYARIAELLGQEVDPVDDPFDGDSGDDSIQGSDQADQISGNGGQDDLSGEGGDDVMYGGSDNDHLYGGDGADILEGGENVDHLYGGNGEDSLYGGAGRDYMYGDDGDDLMDGGDSKDHIRGGAGDDTINAGNGNDRVRAGNENDTIYGGEGNDKLLGNTGEDVIYGGNGKDVLTGGKDTDILYGGAHRDYFVFNTNTGDDVIKDFEDGLDKIHIRRIKGISVDELEDAISTDGDDAIVDLTALGGNGSIVVENAAGNLGASDFLI